METSHRFDNYKNIKKFGIMFKVGQFFNYRSKQNFILHSYLPIYSLFGDTLWANNNLVRLCRIVTFQKEDVKNVAKIKYRESTFNTFKELNSLRIRELNELEFFFCYVQIL